MGIINLRFCRLRKERASKRASEGSMAGTGAPVSFSTGICDCCTDCESCCIGYFVPSILYGQNKEKIEGVGQFMPDCCAFFWIHLICGCFARYLKSSPRLFPNNASELFSRTPPSFFFRPRGHHQLLV